MYSFEEDKKYLIVDGLLIIIVSAFTAMLHLYNQKLYEIQLLYENSLSQTFAIVQEPDYFYYLIAGFVFIVLLIGAPVFCRKSRCNLLSICIIIFINLIMLIILLVVFWNPVLATFAAFLTFAGICLAVNK